MSILSHCDDSGLLVLTLNDPDRRNPVGHAARTDLARLLAEAEADDAIRAVVLTGSGGHFSAGGDIRDQGLRTIACHRARFATIRDLMLRIVRYSKPIASAVEGWAAGGGFALAVACPTVIAARDARFTASFTKIGLIPDMGLLATLPARIGPAQARRLMLDNRVIAAPEAQALGIADAVCDPGAALDLASAQVMAQAEGAPLARQLIIDWFARDVAAALDYEQTVQPGLLNSDDAAEGRAAFRDKRPPVFRGA